MKMVVKVTKSSNNRCWYDSHVGEFFDVLKIWPEGYKVVAPSGYTNIIHNECGELYQTETTVSKEESHEDNNHRSFIGSSLV